MLKILITGASGFIGTNVMRFYLCKYDIANIDIKEPKDKSQSKYWQNIDIRNHDALVAFVNKFSPDYIIHLAARTDLDGLTLSDYDANISGVENMLKAASTVKNLKKIIIASSMLVCHRGYVPKDQFDYAPTTLYGESKVQTESIVWHNKPACDWAIIRPTSIWGPWFGTPYRDFFDMVMTKRYFHIGNKSCTKTYGYVENAVYQINEILLTNTFDEADKVFYIGDKPPVNIEEWANQIAAECGYKIIKLPYFMLYCAALFGDALAKLHIRFPMTSFRLKNMTKNNIVNLDNTYAIAPNPPVDRLDAVKKTLEWLKNN